ncbi:hypothetical protein NOVOSPHI9U_260124 [Novosphingobium sp. 9U]|nr:hypothetical protein [Novosphingobium sp. 9U]VWX49987.1 hypothetical protein NOVOSPHI9U_260124 [Novosphingobium sp. 9U]
MFAYQLVGADGIHNLKRIERPVPTPARGQILIRMRAASLNFRDLLVANGYYGVELPMPVIPLSDAPARWWRWATASPASPLEIVPARPSRTTGSPVRRGPSICRHRWAVLSTAC